MGFIKTTSMCLQLEEKHYQMNMLSGTYYKQLVINSVERVLVQFVSIVVSAMKI